MTSRPTWSKKSDPAIEEVGVAVQELFAGDEEEQMHG